MNCSFSEKISLLIDGELTPAEENEALRHLAGCAECKRAREDFLSLRSYVKSYEVEPDLPAQRRALRAALASNKTRWWQKRIPLPVPTFALLVISLLALAVWSVIARVSQTGQPSRAKQVKVEPGGPSASASPSNAIDFSRYDGGGRAVIYKTRRDQQDAIRQ